MFAIVIYALALTCVAVIAILAWAFVDVAFLRPRPGRPFCQPQKGFGPAPTGWSPPLAEGESLLQWAIATTEQRVLDRLATKVTPQAIHQLALDVLTGTCQAITASPSTPHRAREYDCSSCRQQRIGVTAPELFAITESLRAERPGQVPQILQRAQTNASRLTQASATPTEGTLICPLLCDDRVCVVHQVRPIQCLGWCPLPQDLESTPQASTKTLDPHAQTLASGITTGLSRGLERRGLDGRQWELNHALAIALRDTSAVQKWLSGEPIFHGSATMA